MKELFLFTCLFLCAALVRGAVFNVTSPADSGPGTLRAAILAANIARGGTIHFALPDGGEVATVSPITPLPPLTAPIEIDGYTQSGSQPNTLPDGNDAVLRVRLDGAKLTDLFGDALVILADNCSVRGLIIVGFPRGIRLDGASHVILAGNWIGVDADGTARGMTFEGINVTTTGFRLTRFNRIGGAQPADRNVIGASHSGIFFFPDTVTDCSVTGNFIGTDPQGRLPRGNVFVGVGMQVASRITVAQNVIGACTSGGSASVSILGGAGHRIAGNHLGVNRQLNSNLGNAGDGIFAQGTTDLKIGGVEAGAGNIIGNHLNHGVFIFASDHVTVEGNAIGTDFGGALPLGNHQAGVMIWGDTNRIGGLAAGAANMIQFNEGPGVAVETGTGNEISGNVVDANLGLGIDLRNDGVTPNDSNDADDGPNRLLNFPVLTTASSSDAGMIVAGTLQGLADTLFHLEFFASPATNTFPQGSRWLGATDMTTQPDGTAAFSIYLPAFASRGEVATATARDAAGNTSEFSAAIPIEVLLPPGVITVERSDAAIRLHWCWGTLQTADALSSATAWETIREGIVSDGPCAQYTVPLPAANPARYFRLAPAR